MSSWMVWVQRQSGLIKVEGCANTFKRVYLDYGRECFMEANIDNQSKSLIQNQTALFYK